MSLRVVPISLEEARTFVGDHHRHSAPAGIARFAIGLRSGDDMVAVSVVGNPKGQGLQNGLTFEVLRVASIALPRVNACSRLYGACARSALAMGFRRGVTYTRVDEPGSSLRASGWWPTARVDGRDWNTGNKQLRWLPGLYLPTTEVIDRIRWETGPDAAPELPELAHLGRKNRRAA
jgi:hypothetical protein